MDLEFKSTSFSEGLCKGLQNICSLTPGWHPKILSMCLNFDVYVLFFFFSPLYFPHTFTARISVSHALILGMVKEHSLNSLQICCTIYPAN